ncbi:hypothetical protein IWW50_002235 [Coemansia erecta]|nr:hypothetical protein IWW50_002235 [Coemansia erecta]
MPQRLPKPVYWVFIAAAASIPLAIVGVVAALYIQSSRTLVATVPPTKNENNEHVQHSSWQEPFSYEAKVYAALEMFVPHNSTEFFESAQLLWHIEPQSLRSKYPRLATRARVDVPQKLRSGGPYGPMLFAHIFLQRAGQFAPHPNMSDPHLVHSATSLAHWQAELADPDDMLDLLSGKGDDGAGSSLDAFGSIPWAIMLENHAIKPVPSRSPFTMGVGRRRWVEKMATTYNPPILVNTISRSYSAHTQLAKAGGPIPRTFSVDLELAGLSKMQFSIKAALLALANGRIRSVVRSDNVLELAKFAANGWSYATYSIDGTTLLDHVKLHGVYVVLAVILAVHALTILGLLTLTISGLFWISPVSSFSGVSRATFGLTIANDVLQILQEARHNDSVLDGFMDGPALISVYVVARILGAPRNPLKWPACVYRRMFSIRRPIDAAEGSMQTNILAEKDGSARPTSRQLRIISAREEIDRASVRWVRFLSGPVVVIAGVFALFENGYNPLSWDYIEDAGRCVSHITLSTCLVPQIVLNYRLRTGSLLPPTDYLFTIVAIFGRKLLDAIAGDDEEGMPGIGLLMFYACNVVILAQWARYYKFKQD